ncbi:MAG: hypothetical protein WAU47_07565 [Desulfobaccales bacterium]
MERSSEDTARKFSIKVETLELDRIIQARKNLDDVKGLAVYAARYMELGWTPVALEAYTGVDLEVDFGQPQATWLWRLMDLALQDSRVVLAIRLTPQSRVLVLKVNPALGKSLDRLGNWRSPCAALLGDLWEHHFLALPPTWTIPAEPIIGSQEAPLAVVRPGQLVVAPPSFDPACQDTWQWVRPPWEKPPGEPSIELLILLEDCGLIVRDTQTVQADLPSWKEIYPLISHSEKLLQALLAPEEPVERYYQKILAEAVQAGFRNLRLLQGLLWHAPHSELKGDPDGWPKLSSWGDRLQELLNSDTTSLVMNAATVIDGAAPSASPDELMTELQVLAAHTLELEQHLEEMEGVGHRAEGGAEDGLGELAELRQAVENFLAGIKDLEEPPSK